MRKLGTPYHTPGGENHPPCTFDEERNMDKSTLREIIITLLIAIIITCIGFATNIHFLLRSVIPTMWGVFSMVFPGAIFRPFIYKKSSYKKPNLVSILILMLMVVFNCFMIYTFFKNTINVFFMFLPYWIWMGISLAARDIYSAFLKKTGKTITTLEEIGIYLIFEIWFLISLIYILIGQILYAKL